MEEIDVWRAAAQMVKMFGTEAALSAAIRSDALLDQGDTAGAGAWKRIVAAIKTLQRAPNEGEPRH